MSNNFLPPQHNQPNFQEQPKRRTGLLSGGYAGAQPPAQQPGAPNPASLAPQNAQMPPMASLPGQFGPQGQPPQPQPPMQQRHVPAFMARPMQMVQRFSNKMAALRRPAPPVDPYPLVRYRPPQPPEPVSERRARPVATYSEPWRRSRTQRITRMMRKRRERWQENSPNKRLGTIISSVTVALLVITLATGAFSSYAYYQTQLPQLQNLASMQIEQSTHFYDRNGNLLYTLYDTTVGRSTPVSYDQIPGYLQDAQIAAEDKTFWTNQGIDVQAIIRSAFIDANAGAAQTGASTLTQQVIKNLINNEPDNKKKLEAGQPPDRSPQRKLTEAALAIGMTQQYPKWKILEMYFNISAYGAQEQGVEAAAQDYFGLKPKCDVHFKCLPAITFLDRDNSAGKCKNANDDSTCPVDPILGLARASLLASLPQNPVIYDPTVFPQYYPQLLARQDYTLHQMESAQMKINLGVGSQINDAQANGQTIAVNDTTIAQAEALSKNFKFVGFQGYNKAPHFVQWVIQQLANALGNYQNIDPNTNISSTGYLMLLTGGYNVRTTLDSNLETYVENAVKRHITQPEYQPFIGTVETLSKDDNLHDSAVVVMSAKTGEMLAMDGSVNYKDKSRAGSGQINMALTPRQPGSSFKPIVMAAAYEQGYYPGIVLGDFKTYFPAGAPLSETVNESNTFVPTDYGHTYHNEYTNIENAMSNSLNIPAIKMGYYVGLQGIYNMAARLGITSIIDKQGATNGLVPSMPIGVDPVSLLQMVDAYQAFANYGVRIPPQGILDVYDNYGHNLYHYDPTHPSGTRVLSQQIAYLVTSTLNSSPEVVRDREAEFGNDHALDMTDWTLPDGTHPDVAAKTGTTGTGTINDNWTLGYTPDVVVGVWSGNADDSPITNAIGVTGAAPIWHSVIEYASGHCETNLDQIPCPQYDLNFKDYHFTKPDGIIQQEVNKVNGLAGTGYMSYMLEGEQPSQSGLTPCTTANTGGNGGNGGRHHRGNGGNPPTTCTATGG
jgi:membrane peptidoglycan carboxypeptidase